MDLLGDGLDRDFSPEIDSKKDGVTTADSCSNLLRKSKEKVRLKRRGERGGEKNIQSTVVCNDAQDNSTEVDVNISRSKQCIQSIGSESRREHPTQFTDLERADLHQPMEGTKLIQSATRQRREERLQRFQATARKRSVPNQNANEVENERIISASISRERTSCDAANVDSTISNPIRKGFIESKIAKRTSLLRASSVPKVRGHDIISFTEASSPITQKPNASRALQVRSSRMANRAAFHSFSSTSVIEEARGKKDVAAESTVSQTSGSLSCSDAARTDSVNRRSVFRRPSSVPRDMRDSNNQYISTIAEKVSSNRLAISDSSKTRLFTEKETKPQKAHLSIGTVQEQKPVVASRVAVDGSSESLTRRNESIRPTVGITKRVGDGTSSRSKGKKNAVVDSPSKRESFRRSWSAPMSLSGEATALVGASGSIARKPTPIRLLEIPPANHPSFSGSSRMTENRKPKVCIPKGDGYTLGVEDSLDSKGTRLTFRRSYSDPTLPTKAPTNDKVQSTGLCRGEVIRGLLNNGKIVQTRKKRASIVANYKLRKSPSSKHDPCSPTALSEKEPSLGTNALQFDTGPNAVPVTLSVSTHADTCTNDHRDSPRSRRSAKGLAEKFLFATKDATSDKINETHCPPVVRDLGSHSITSNQQTSLTQRAMIKSAIDVKARKLQRLIDDAAVNLSLDASAKEDQPDSPQDDFASLSSEKGADQTVGDLCGHSGSDRSLDHRSHLDCSNGSFQSETHESNTLNKGSSNGVEALDARPLLGFCDDALGHATVNLPRMVDSSDGLTQLETSKVPLRCTASQFDQCNASSLAFQPVVDMLIDNSTLRDKIDNAGDSLALVIGTRDTIPETSLAFENPTNCGSADVSKYSTDSSASAHPSVHEVASPVPDDTEDESTVERQTTSATHAFTDFNIPSFDLRPLLEEPDDSLRVGSAWDTNKIFFSEFDAGQLKNSSPNEIDPWSVKTTTAASVVIDLLRSDEYENDKFFVADHFDPTGWPVQIETNWLNPRLNDDPFINVSEDLDHVNRDDESLIKHNESTESVGSTCHAEMHSKDERLKIYEKTNTDDSSLEPCSDEEPPGDSIVDLSDLSSIGYFSQSSDDDSVSRQPASLNGVGGCFDELETNERAVDGIVLVSAKSDEGTSNDTYTFSPGFQFLPNRSFASNEDGLAVAQKSARGSPSGKSGALPSEDELSERRNDASTPYDVFLPSQLPATFENSASSDTFTTEGGVENDEVFAHVPVANHNAFPADTTEVTSPQIDGFDSLMNSNEFATRLDILLLSPPPPPPPGEKTKRKKKRSKTESSRKSIQLIAPIPEEKLKQWESENGKILELTDVLKRETISIISKSQDSSLSDRIPSSKADPEALCVHEIKLPSDSVVEESADVHQSLCNGRGLPEKPVELNDSEDQMLLNRNPVAHVGLQPNCNSLPFDLASDCPKEKAPTPDDQGTCIKHVERSSDLAVVTEWSTFSEDGAFVEIPDAIFDGFFDFPCLDMPAITLDDPQRSSPSPASGKVVEKLDQPVHPKIFDELALSSHDDAGRDITEITGRGHLGKNEGEQFDSCSRSMSPSHGCDTLLVCSKSKISSSDESEEQGTAQFTEILPTDADNNDAIYRKESVCPWGNSTECENVPCPSRADCISGSDQLWRGLSDTQSGKDDPATQSNLESMSELVTSCIVAASTAVLDPEQVGEGHGHFKDPQYQDVDDGHRSGIDTISPENENIQSDSRSATGISTLYECNEGDEAIVPSVEETAFRPSPMLLDERLLQINAVVDVETPTHASDGNGADLLTHQHQEINGARPLQSLVNADDKSLTTCSACPEESNETFMASADCEGTSSLDFRDSLLACNHDLVDAMPSQFEARCPSASNEVLTTGSDCRAEDSIGLGPMSLTQQSARRSEDATNDITMCIQSGSNCQRIDGLSGRADTSQDAEAGLQHVQLVEPTSLANFAACDNRDNISVVADPLNAESTSLLHYEATDTVLVAATGTMHSTGVPSETQADASHYFEPDESRCRNCCSDPTSKLFHLDSDDQRSDCPRSAVAAVIVQKVDVMYPTSSSRSNDEMVVDGEEDQFVRHDEEKLVSIGSAIANFDGHDGSCGKSMVNPQIDEFQDSKPSVQQNHGTIDLGKSWNEDKCLFTRQSCAGSNVKLLEDDRSSNVDHVKSCTKQEFLKPTSSLSNCVKDSSVQSAISEEGASTPKDEYMSASTELERNEGTYSAFGDFEQEFSRQPTSSINTILIENSTTEIEMGQSFEVSRNDERRSLSILEDASFDSIDVFQRSFRHVRATMREGNAVDEVWGEGGCNFRLSVESPFQCHGVRSEHSSIDFLSEVGSTNLGLPEPCSESGITSGHTSPFTSAFRRDPHFLPVVLDFLGDPVAVCRMKMVDKACNTYIDKNEYKFVRDAVRRGGMNMNVRPYFWLWVTLQKASRTNCLDSKNAGIVDSSISDESELRTLRDLGKAGKWSYVIERDVPRAFGNLPPHKTGARLRTDSIVRALVTWGKIRMMKRGASAYGEVPLQSTNESTDAEQDGATPTGTVSDWGGVTPVGSFNGSFTSSISGAACNDEGKPKSRHGSSRHRTRDEDLALNGNALTDDMKALLQVKLSFILHALAAAHPEVGYCQGMDYVVAHLLRILKETILWKAANGTLPSVIKCTPWFQKRPEGIQDLASVYEEIDKSVVVEETCFRVMHSFFTVYNLQHFYWPELRCLKTCCRVFEKLIQIKLPVLADHFDHHELNVGLFALGWFQTLFLYLPSMPSSTVCHMWDIWLVERSYKIFFRVGCAILFLSQPILLNHELEGMMNYLNTFPDATLLSPDILIACALQIKVTNRMLMTLEQEVGVK